MNTAEKNIVIDRAIKKLSKLPITDEIKHLIIDLRIVKLFHIPNAILERPDWSSSN
jgi:hypothetical protein